MTIHVGAIEPAGKGESSAARESAGKTRQQVDESEGSMTSRSDESDITACGA